MELTNLPLRASEFSDLHEIVWGTDFNDDIHERWRQGFTFNDSNSVALVQLEGGPCAVIAPVQAFILKIAIFSSPHSPGSCCLTASNEEAKRLLAEALLEILLQASDGRKFTIFTVNSLSHATSGSSRRINNESEFKSESETSVDGPSSANTPDLEGFLRGTREVNPVRAASAHEARLQGGLAAMDSDDSCLSSVPSLSKFTSLRCYACADRGVLRNVLRGQWLTDLQGPDGLLLFLYSLLLCRGLDRVRTDMGVPYDPLIDGLHGHGSQNLVNLMLTGRAVAHVHDNERTVDGLRLSGIGRQSDIGFLSLLESHRLLEVGWFLKNPNFPIWLLGSETHLTVLFSMEASMVNRNSPSRQAEKVFNQFDGEGRGFVETPFLADLLSAMGLFSEQEYVELMKTRLDPEELGFVTRWAFMEEFFPELNRPKPVDNFEFWHYNGLKRSNTDSVVKFRKLFLSISDTDYVTLFDDDVSQFQKCLRSKWPYARVRWEDGQSASLN